MWRRHSLRVISATLAAVAAVAIAAPHSLLTQLAGEYTRKFKNGDISGATYYSTDVVKIFPLDRRRALISFELSFFNGHTCGVYGVAKVEGDKLVYRDRSEWLSDEPECALNIWRDRTKLHWEDEGTCHFHCGSRGGFSNGEMPITSQRVIVAPPSRPLP